MILLQALTLSTIVALWRGGKLSRLLSLPLRWPVAPLVCYASQVVMLRLAAPRPAAFDLIAVALFLSNLVLLLTAAVNRHIPGMTLVGLGLLLNLAVMVANGGYMPIAPETMARIGYDGTATLAAGTRLAGYKDIVLPPEQTALFFLSDILVPPWPFAPNAFSIGDVLVTVGAFVALQWALLAPGTQQDPRQKWTALALTHWLLEPGGERNR